MTVVNFHIKPQGEVLEAYYNDRAPCSFIMGPLGSGKTTTSCQRLFKLMCQQLPNREGVRPTRWYAVRNTYPDLMTTTIKDWLELVGDIGKFTGGGFEPPTWRGTFSLPNDGTTVKAEVVFIALDRPDAVKKLRGSQVTGFWLNETKELDKAVVDMADARHGRYPSMAAGGVIATWHGMFGDTNAPDEDSWYYKQAEEVKPDGWNFHRQPGGVNIKKVNGKDSFSVNLAAENIDNLPDKYYQRLIQGKADDWVRINLANEYGFVVSGRPVMPEYIDSFHCRPCAYDPNLVLNIGMDFGLTPAATFTQRSPMGQVRVIAELVATRLGAKNFAREIKALISLNGWSNARMGSITGDPAGNQGQQSDETMTVFKMMASEGIIALPAHSNIFATRRETVADQLTKVIDAEPALIIDPSCKTLRKGMAGGYCYRRIQVVGSERYQDKPDKTPSSHVCEALQYDLMGQGISRETILQPQHTLEMMANRPRVAVTEFNPF